jgi:translation elongation factor P/translation initiation factor 5A
MKKTAVELKKGDNILVANQKCLIEELEISDIGKQGKRKVRILAKNEKEEKIVLIRPEDYPFEFIS